ncbi:HAD family hydrolase [Propionibacterium sp.]|uniref:HAD family hydrolase n=1 Tax=Propionibacterium sp. TaxID=1977903 RepID=UPI0039E9C0E4
MTTARELFHAASTILLDFDGPVVGLLPPPLNSQLAETAKAAFRQSLGFLPPEFTDTTDHIAIIKAAGRSGSSAALAAVERTCTRAETDAALVSTPTPGVSDLLDAARQHGKTVVIVSNNCPACISAFLAAQGLAEFVDGIVGRDPQHPELMKPDPDLLDRALALAGSPSPCTCCFIGDSLTDDEAAAARGISFLGYAKSARHALRFKDHGTEVTVHALTDML